MVSALGTTFAPNKVVLLRPTEEQSPDIVRFADYTRFQTGIDGRATAYVCVKSSCKLPVIDPGKMLELLGAKTTEVSRSSQ